MEQLEFFTVPSPCVGVCTSDEKGYCKGCMRKREERFNWLNLTPAQQLHVIKLCRQRYRRKMLARKTKPEQLQDNSSPQQDLF
ncbi:DUF1289 domain-containing protein [Vibrio parahaemolyticus]|uniref:DUF1289 domain-containing protein n=2 Tax=Vibrio parahaemolyticus TaxID=670 RepID=A0A0L8TYV7_VIBPH|nr:DUF1289 domain-containing protein [Vibrio parahaemolyticus]ARC17555.1 DUF1289 domain-containing protein [Vibrio parahaemolyticus]AZV71282.1 DUF1289 domain-containing protein [Vibrio parahaemolyticus]EGQ8050429.1 DUF1289 domain-containing protein [Vibrio parahaemolyticus]EGQ8304160.1 DUF1289 domain-containing protein [Vibrio parahaemolyticus]EGQ8456395.1 DUF1289 domain-containing protein [Vibrio parahaemolyticus]